MRRLSPRLPRDVAPEVRAVWDRSWVTPWAWSVLALYDVVFGATLLAGGAERINGPSFTTLAAVGSVPSGLLTAALGVGMALAAFHSRWLLRAVTALTALTFLGIAAGFVAAWINEPVPPPELVAQLADIGLPPPAKAAWTGIPTYLLVAVVHGLNIAVYGPRGPLGPALFSAPAQPPSAAPEPDGDGAGEDGARG